MYDTVRSSRARASWCSDLVERGPNDQFTRLPGGESDGLDAPIDLMEVHSEPHPHHGDRSFERVGVELGDRRSGDPADGVRFLAIRANACNATFGPWVLRWRDAKRNGRDSRFVEQTHQIVSGHVAPSRTAAEARARPMPPPVAHRRPFEAVDQLVHDLGDQGAVVEDQVEARRASPDRASRAGRPAPARRLPRRSRSRAVGLDAGGRGDRSCPVEALKTAENARGSSSRLKRAIQPSSVQILPESPSPIQRGRERFPSGSTTSSFNVGVDSTSQRALCIAVSHGLTADTSTRPAHLVARRRCQLAPDPSGRDSTFDPWPGARVSKPGRSTRTSPGSGSLSCRCRSPRRRGPTWPSPSLRATDKASLMASSFHAPRLVPPPVRGRPRRTGPSIGRRRPGSQAHCSELPDGPPPLRRTRSSPTARSRSRSRPNLSHGDAMSGLRGIDLPGALRNDFGTGGREHRRNGTTPETWQRWPATPGVEDEC